MIGDFISLLSLLSSAQKHCPVLTRPRCWIRLFLVGVFFAIALLYHKLGWLSMERPLLLFLVWGAVILYGFLSYLAVIRPLLWSKAKLDHLNSLVAEGWSLNYDHLFSHKPLYFWDMVEHFNYRLAEAKYLQRRGQDRAAWEVYSAIPEGNLTPAERDTLKLKMATHAVNRVGDVHRAKKLLEDVKNRTSPEYLICSAYVAETEGDWDQSLKLLQDALALCPVELPSTKAAIYNNFARMRRLEGNYTDAIYYLQQAATEALKGTEKDTLHATYQNLIQSKMLAGEKIDQIRPILDTYVSRLNPQIINDWLELTQLNVDMARQLGDRVALVEHLSRGYWQLMTRPDINAGAKIRGAVNVLRSMVSSQMLPEEVWENIIADADTYMLLELPDRVYALKELASALDFLRDQRDLNAKEQELDARIRDYMKQQAGRELEDYMAKLPPYAVHERCNLYWERAALVKRYEAPYSFEKVYSLLADAKDTYRVNGQFMNSARVDLDIADEALAVQRRDVLQTHVVLAEQSLAQLRKHPAAAEFYLRLAYYWASLYEIPKADHYFRLFEKAGISIDHYAPWLQDYFRTLATFLRQPGGNPRRPDAGAAGGDEEQRPQA